MNASRVVQAAMLRFRWIGHNADVCVVLEAGEIRFVAVDVFAAVGLGTDDFADQPGIDEPSDERIRRCTTWTLDQLEQIFRDVFDQTVLDFLEWASALAADVRQQLEDVELAATPPAPRVAALDPVATIAEPADSQLPASYSVQQAAQILSRDPAIRVGQRSLFELLQSIGWTIRVNGTWEPTSIAKARGYLIVIRRDVPVLHDLYPQITLTSAGLNALHKRLGGQAHIALDPIATHQPELSL